MRAHLFHILILLAISLAVPIQAKQAPVDIRQIDNTAIETAFTSRQQDVQLQGRGKIEKILADDNHGSRHQRFIVRINARQTVLIAHNIDLAPRVANAKTGDWIYFYGEYEWNPKGGVVHWTHHDPQGRHLAGWLKHNGITYQ
ncbi:MAG TPA: DUF3465 domain-containing protein [Cellvibrio sp.]|nr:DUF3465 domain-containing protein [Cellvibrio sp.]